MRALAALAPARLAARLPVRPHPLSGNFGGARAAAGAASSLHSSTTAAAVGGAGRKLVGFYAGGGFGGGGIGGSSSTGAAGRRASSSSSRAAATTPSAPSPPTGVDGTSWDIKVLHDGECPLCEREINMLKARNPAHGNKIAFVDIASPSYNPADHGGLSYEAAMRTIHAIKRDGTVIQGVTVFKELYERVGLGFVYAFLSVPPLRAAAEALYNAWAAARLPITGRPGLEVVLKEKATCRE